MTRKLTSHRVNELNSALEIEVLDGPDAIGGACHEYVIKGVEGPLDNHPIKPCEIHFQNGPVPEVGYNGISQEALLAIVEDRLISFQAGPFSCRENAIALTKIQEAMMWLRKRTIDRMNRGVEGSHQK